MSRFEITVYALKQRVLERFLKYVEYDTTSNYDSGSVPSTDGQKDFAAVLAKECEALGFDSVELTDTGYIYCYLSGTMPDNLSVGFIAHIDTSPDCKGSEIKARIIENYDGREIKLNESTSLSPEKFDALKNYIGCDIVTTNGETLLGADDKAGIAEIMTALERIINSVKKRPDIYVAFTPDEEVGRGMDKFDLSLFKADYAFTVDGEGIGELEYESFNAARGRLSIKGTAIHPGYAKGVMKNAALIAAEFINELPKNETPGETEGYEGFFHVNSLSASVEKAEISLLIRDFECSNFASRKKLINDIVNRLNIKHGNIITLTIADEYFNMGKVISEHMSLINTVSDVCEANGITPVIRPIRGGTDGSRLSFMGIPCPNLFTGGHNFHSPFEFIPVQSMVKAVDVIVGIVGRFSEIKS